MKTAMIFAAFAAALSSYADVVRTDVPPAIDGKLDDACWSAAEWNGPFVRLANSVKDRTVRAQTGTTGVSPVAMKRTRPFRAVKFNTAE